MPAHPTDPRAVADDRTITVWRDDVDLVTAARIHGASDA